ncbi:HD domain-containing protein [Nocardia higoensis]|uniref:HD domain-containing protein n=1 Tax=Nocardia higoensis TaxID=228599 RepID=UPI000A068187|nr:HD domain-containing protein [Nocardia higoensis]
MTLATAVAALDAATLGPDAFCDALFAYLETTGQTMYDETVTQLEHGLQCAALAEAEGHGPKLQIAALLHDIGHLMLDEHDDRDDFLETDLRHEIIGARLVTRWFGPEVGGPIALHVPAKRYLVATDPEYANGLSASSVRSLAVQGGPMNAAELEAFRQTPYYAEAVLVRRWDDLAKVADLTTPPLEHWRGAITHLLAAWSADK